MLGWVVRVAVVLLVLLNAGLFYVALTRDRGASVDRTPTQASPTSVRTSRAPTTTASAPEPSPADTHLAAARDDSTPSATTDAIVLTRAAYETEPFQVVRVSGTMRIPAPAARGQVHVEVRRGDGWSTFPLPAVTGNEGRFTAFVSIGSPGRYRMRVAAPGGRPASDPFLVTVR